MASVTTAAARFTNDSSASDRSPTEPVSHHAAPLSAIVATAARIDSQAKRTSEPRAIALPSAAERTQSRSFRIARSYEHTAEG